MFEETILKEKENYIRGLEQKVRDLNHEIWNECDKLSKMKISNANEKFGVKEGDKISITYIVHQYQGFDAPIKDIDETIEGYFKGFEGVSYNVTHIVLTYYKTKKDGSRSLREGCLNLSDIKEIKKI